MGWQKLHQVGGQEGFGSIAHASGHGQPLTTHPWLSGKLEASDAPQCSGGQGSRRASACCLWTGLEHLTIFQQTAQALGSGQEPLPG